MNGESLTEVKCTHNKKNVCFVNKNDTFAQKYDMKYTLGIRLKCDKYLILPASRESELERVKSSCADGGEKIMF